MHCGKYPPREGPGRGWLGRRGRRLCATFFKQVAGLAGAVRPPAPLLFVSRTPSPSWVNRKFSINVCDRLRDGVDNIPPIGAKLRFVSIGLLGSVAASRNERTFPGGARRRAPERF